MRAGVRLEVKQSQRLAMTPQLQQAIKLLQMSNLELHAFLAEETEKNPLLCLEEASDRAVEEDAAAAPEAQLDAALDRWSGREGGESLGAEVFDNGTENLYDAAPTPGTGNDWAGVGAGGSRDFGSFDAALEAEPGRPRTLREHLVAQIGQSRTGPREAAIARVTVEELDEAGYLRADPAELAARLGAAPAEVDAALTLLRSCDPTGIGAQGLAECLSLQLAERDRLDPAMRTLLENLNLVGRGERRRLRALCGVDDEDLADMLAELRALDPRPGAVFQAERAETRVPDVLLRRNPSGGWDVELNPEGLPRAVVDRRYAARLEGGGAPARRFLAECRANAHWLVRSLDQRARTILAVSAEIVRQQERFLAEGIAGLRPLTLRMVAEATGLHESTVSRVTANKSIATERGVLDFRFFFTNAVGEDGPAAESVRHRIRALVEAEAPGAVLSDDAIVARLKAEGIDIARRTVAKYRTALGIPSSAARRRMKATLAST